MSWRELAPEPSRFWLRFAPKSWPAADQPFVDLVDHRIEWPEGDAAAALPDRPTRGRDLLWAPPVARSRRSERERWVLDVERSGGLALVQVGTEEAAEPAVTGLRVLDLLAPLLDGAPRAVEETPVEVAAALPLIPGLSAGPEAWDPWLSALARLGPGRCVVGIPVELSPVDRRRLAERRGEAQWEALFHGGPPSPRAFARSVAEHGLDPFPRRPQLELFPRRRRNRDLATLLRECGELWLRLERAEPTGQGLLAAARHVEATPLDIAGLAREGNLGVLGWLSPTAREVIGGAVAEEAGAEGTTLLDSLRAEYVGGAEEDG